MQIFVCGKLGEVVKKVIELQNLIKEHPENKMLITELASFQQVLDMWPVDDKDLIDQCINVFRVNIGKLQMAEISLRRLEFGNPFVDKAVRDYFDALDNVRDDMKAINSLGKHIGESPWLEVVDAEPEANCRPT